MSYIHVLWLFIVEWSHLHLFVIVNECFGSIASGLTSAPGFMEMTNEWACLGYGLANCDDKQAPIFKWRHQIMSWFCNIWVRRLFLD